MIGASGVATGRFESEVRPPQVAVWSCKVAGEAFASDSTATLLLCQEPRPQSILLGVFAFWPGPSGRVS